MKKLFSIAVLALLLSSQNFAQRQLSLSEAMTVAIANAEEIKNLKIDEQIQFTKNEEVIKSALPQVSATGQTTYYTNLPKILFPSSNYPVYDVLQKEGVKNGSGTPITVDNAVTTSQTVSFIAPFNMQFGVGVNQLLFQPDLFIAFKARQTVLDYTKQNTAVAEERIKEAVQKAYYNVLIAQKQKEVLTETTTRIDKLLSDMTAMYKSGFAEKLDIDKLTVTKNNTLAATNQLDNAISISNSLLKNTLGLPTDEEIVLTEKLDLDELKGFMAKNDEHLNFDNRKEITLLNTARSLQDLDMQRHKLGYLPTVAAFFNFQRQGQYNKNSFGDSPWLWFNTGLIGLNVNQPIFDGGQRKKRTEVAMLNISKIDNSINQAKRGMELEHSIAKTTINNALLNLDVQQRNVDLAKTVYETTKKKYEAGLGSSFELIQTDTELQRANGSYLQALYDAYVAHVGYKKSIGKL
jgi:outer membrane protein